jgi:TonB family protein
MRVRWVLAVMVALVFAGAATAAQETVYRIRYAGVTAPVLVREFKPGYTAQAMRERAQGLVKLTCVVGTDGKPRDIHIVAPLHPELDQAAVAALSAWEFKPGMKDGVAVPVLVDIEMTFRLADRRPRHEFDTPGVFKKEDQGVVVPAVLQETKPKYTADAMRERIEGNVVLECIVEPDGSVGNVRVTQSLDSRLDGEAVAALKLWRFKPGTKDGVAAPVQVRIEMTFRLK